MPERAICKNKGNHAKMSQTKMMATYSERRELNQNVRIHNSREGEKISQKWAKQKYHYYGTEGIEPECQNS